MNPNAPAKPNVQRLSDSLRDYAIKNRLIRDASIAHKLAQDFLPNVELYVKELLTYETFESKVETHKLNVRLAEAATLNALLEKKVLDSRRIAESMIDLNQELLVSTQLVIKQQADKIKQAKADLVEVGY